MINSNPKFKRNLDKEKPADEKLRIGSDELITVHELSERLKISVSGLYKLVHRRRIPFHKIGQLIRFNYREVLNVTLVNKKGND